MNGESAWAFYFYFSGKNNKAFLPGCYSRESKTVSCIVTIRTFIVEEIGICCQPSKLPGDFNSQDFFSPSIVMYTQWT